MKKLNLLSKAEMKKVMGGVADSGTCCIHDASWDNPTCGLSASAAEAGAVGGMLWCCEHCEESRLAAMGG